MSDTTTLSLKKKDVYMTP